MVKRENPTHTGSGKVPSGDMAAGAFVVRPGRNRFEPHRTHWRELEYAQAAIGVLFSGAPPPHVNLRALTVKVNAWLAQQPEWRASGYGEISRMTVTRALEMFRAINR